METKKAKNFPSAAKYERSHDKMAVTLEKVNDEN